MALRPQSNKSAAKSSGGFWNLLTAFVLVGAVLLIAAFAFIYLYPESFLNPFPPSSMPVALNLPTPTPTVLNALPPTWTPTNTAEPTATVTPRPTLTATIVPTTFVLPSVTITYTPTLTPEPFFALSEGIDYVRAGTITGRGCSWLGVGGVVVDLAGEQIPGLSVVLGGEFEGKRLNQSTRTGGATAYGDGGWEFSLADEPTNTKEDMFVQLFGATGKPISSPVYFRVYDSCDRNLVLINFEQVD